MVISSRFSWSPVVLLCCALLVSGCQTNKRGGPVAYDVANFGAPQPLPLSDASTQYHIAPGDTLAISVFQVPSLTRTIEVDAAGGFDYPPIGWIKVNNRSVSDVRDEIRSKLGASYLNSPSVEVSLKSTVGNQITVDGAVQAPGIYPVAPGTTLLQVVAVAKGATKEANLRRVVIFRRIDGQRMAAAFDLLDIRRGVAPDVEVYSRDVIVIDGSTSRQGWTDILSTLPLLTLFRPF